MLRTPLGFFVADAGSSKEVAVSALKPTRASILRFKHLQQRINLSRSTIYARISAGDFPSPVSLGPRAVGWLESDIQNWITSRARKEVRPSRGSPSFPEETLRS